MSKKILGKVIKKDGIKINLGNEQIIATAVYLVRDSYKTGVSVDEHGSKTVIVSRKILKVKDDKGKKREIAKHGDAKSFFGDLAGAMAKGEPEVTLKRTSEGSPKICVCNLPPDCPKHVELS